MKKNQYILIVAALFIAGLSFFAGTHYQSGKGNGNAQSANETMANGTASGQRTGQKTGQQNNEGGMQTGIPGNGLVSGEITNKDGQGLTLKLSDGSSKIIIVADSTSYKKSTDVFLEDLTVGETVTVIGATNTDGSVTAKTVTIGEATMPLGQGRPEDLPEGAQQTAPLENN